MRATQKQIIGDVSNKMGLFCSQEIIVQPFFYEIRLNSLTINVIGYFIIYNPQYLEFIHTSRPSI